MRNLVLLILAVVVGVVILIGLGFLDLTPEGAEAIDSVQENVGQAVQATGEAIEGAGQDVQEAE